MAGLVGAPTVGALVLSRFEAPGSESHRAATALREEFGTGSPNLLLLLTVRDGTVDDPAIAAAGRELTAELAGADGVAEAYSYWTRDASPVLRSEDGTQAVLLA
ncbi:RND transporter, partial [Marinitenerispora sediminis]